MRVKVTLTLQVASRPSSSQATLGGDEDEDGEDEGGDPGDFSPPPRVQQLPEAARRSLFVRLLSCFSCGGDSAGELPTLSSGCKGDQSRTFVWKTSTDLKI